MTFQTKQTLDFWLGGLLLLFLFLPVRGLGLLLRRDHSVARRRGCAVIKLVGAGGLFLAIPSLQAIRGQFPLGVSLEPAKYKFPSAVGRHFVW
jgi:hypothetical protein